MIGKLPYTYIPNPPWFGIVLLKYLEQSVGRQKSFMKKQDAFLVLVKIGDLILDFQCILAVAVLTNENLLGKK